MMEKKKSLKVNFILNSVLSMSSLLFALVTFPYVSRVLSADGLGKVNFAISLISYITIFSQLGIPVYGIRACAKFRDDKVKLSRTVQELMIIQLGTTVIAYVILFVLLRMVPRLQNDRALYVVAGFNIFLLYIGMEWLYRALETYAYITARSIVFKAIALVGMFVLVKEKTDYIKYAGIFIFATSASGCLNLCYARKYIFLKPVGGYDFRQHLKPVFVFFAMACATTIYTNLDTVMLGFMASDTEVGYYSTAVKVKALLVSLVTSLGTVLLPRASYYIQNDMKEDFLLIIKKSLNFIVLASAPLVLYFMMFAEYGIRFLAGDGYEGAIVPMIVIMPTLLLIGFSNVTGIQVLVPMGREKTVLISEFMGAIIDLILNFLLIPVLASTGAAIGTLIAEIAVLAWQYSSSGKLFKNAASGIHYGRIVLALMIAGMCSVWIKQVQLGDFATLLISACLFFGSYIACMLFWKEPLFMEVLQRKERGDKNETKKDVIREDSD